MPSFNILKAFSSKPQPARPAGMIAKDYAYPTLASESSPTSPAMAYSQSSSVPPRIIKSQPLTDPSLGRRGTLKKKNKHRHHHSDDTSRMQWAEPQYLAQNEIPLGPHPPPHHPSAGYQPSNPSVYPDEYPYPYEDHHQQRFQYGTGPPVPRAMSTRLEDPPVTYPEPPRPMHHGHSNRHHRGHHHSPHRHHHHHHHPPQQHDYPAPPAHGQGSHHGSWRHDHSRSRSRSFTPIPSVYRESESMDLEDSYADPIAHGVGINVRRSGHGPEVSGTHQSQGRIGWVVDNKLEEKSNDTGAVPIVDEPKVIPGPIESDNPLGTNVYHTHESGYDPNRKGQEYAHQSRHRDPGAPGLKAYMYKDVHFSETIEPKMYERRPTHDESDSEPEEYRYIVPSGVHVVFRDHDGNEITRIGYPGPVPAASKARHMAPFTVQDEFGNVLYRHGGSERSRHGAKDRHSRPSRSTQVIMIDEHGNQIPLKSNESHSNRSHRSHHSHHSHHTHSHHPGRRRSHH